MENVVLSAKKTWNLVTKEEEIIQIERRTYTSNIKNLWLLKDAITLINTEKPQSHIDK